MTVSPDFEAVYCYILVFLLGMIAAKGQVSRRLTNLPGQWIMVNTWLLYFAYALLPVALFWFLDRTNAVHDTSVFAAALVGLGYQQILSGGIGTVRAPGEASKLWQPFAAWADRISDRIRDRIAVNDSRFDERLLSAIRNDPVKFDALKSVALVHAINAKEIDDKLKEIEAQADVLGENGVLAKKAELLYLTLKKTNTKTFGYILYKSEVIPRKWYYWYAQEWRSKTAAILVALALAGLAVMAFVESRNPGNIARYYVWRLHKDNTTDYDHFRARRKLTGYLNAKVYQELGSVLRIPSLPVKTADNILGLMLETRQTSAARDSNLAAILLESLRTENPDIRLRIYKVLVYYADEKGIDTKPMQAWQPDSKDTPVRIDEMIRKWKELNL